MPEHRHQDGGVPITRFHALVLFPGDADTSEEEACEADAKFLYPFMRSEDEPGSDHQFDWFLQPDDLATLDDALQLIWRACDIVEPFGELDVEANLTPDGRWHAAEAGQLWDDGGGWPEHARSFGNTRNVSRCGTCFM